MGNNMPTLRTKAQIEWAIDAIRRNVTLTYGYREDCIAVLEWVLGGEAFDGLAPAEGTTFANLVIQAIVPPMPPDDDDAPPTQFVRPTPLTLNDILFS